MTQPMTDTPSGLCHSLCHWFELCSSIDQSITPTQGRERTADWPPRVPVFV